MILLRIPKMPIKMITKKLLWTMSIYRWNLNSSADWVRLHKSQYFTFFPHFQFTNLSALGTWFQQRIGTQNEISSNSALNVEKKWAETIFVCAEKSGKALPHKICTFPYSVNHTQSKSVQKLNSISVIK